LARGAATIVVTANKSLNHAAKTTTLQETEAQVRNRRFNLGDWHANHLPVPEANKFIGIPP